MLKKLHRLNTTHLFSFASLLLMVFLMACSATPKSTVVTGKISDYNNGLIHLRWASDSEVETIDTIRTDGEGNFKLVQSIDSPRILMLEVEGENNSIIILAEPGETITLNGHVKNIAQNYTVSGSRGSLLVRELNLKFHQTIRNIDSLSVLYKANREHPRFDSIKTAIDSIYNKTIEAHKNYTIHFIKENRYSLAAILALYQQYDKQKQVLNGPEDFELFRLVDSLLYPLYPENQLVYNLHRNVERINHQLKLLQGKQDMIPVGSIIPRLELNGINGEIIMLWEPKFRYTLVDFWATWCADCISINQQLKTIYSTFSTKGFGIVQVSLDVNPTDLKKAIEQDTLTWLHVSDYKQWDSPIIDSLRISCIPANYLLDNKGVVVERNLSPKELNELLQRLLP